jgi:pimeloyl-ACP methyl ester carboxylesterase
VGEAIVPENIIHHPTLFVKGENSDYITEKDIEEIKTYFENAEIKTISGAGHWVHAEQSEIFVRTVKEFLR